MSTSLMSAPIPAPNTRPVSTVHTRPQTTDAPARRAWGSRTTTVPVIESCQVWRLGVHSGANQPIPSARVDSTEAN